MTNGLSETTGSGCVLEWRHSTLKFLKKRGADLTIVTIGVTALMIGPAWAGGAVTLPGPAAGILAGGAIIGALVITKWWRRK